MAADIDPVAVAVFRKDVEGTLAVAAAAVVAEIFIDIDLAVHDLGDVDGTCLHDLTLLAAVAFGKVRDGDLLPDDAQVVQIRLDAVIGAAADADFEFVGQGDVVIAQVEALVDLLAQIVSVDQAVLTGRTLAGDDRADQRAGAAGRDAVGCQKIDERLDVFIFDALDFKGQPGRQRDDAGAELVRRVGDDPVLLGADPAVAGDGADIEDIRIAFIPQTAQELDALDLLRGDFRCGCLLYTS